MTTVPLSQALTQAREIEALRAEVKWRREREIHFAALLGVPDGGQYRNDWDARLTALVAELEALRIAHARADGALADAETVPTGDLERGIRALTAERDGLRDKLARLVAALDDCEGNRGRFSCTDPHDARCPKARAEWAADWRGVWQCECGAEELEATVDTARPGVVGGREEGT